MNLLDRFSKYAKASNLMKIRPVAAELFHADRRKDGWTIMSKPIVAFRNFAHAPNKIIFKSRFSERVFAIADENVGSVSNDIYVYQPQEWTRIKQGVRRDIT
jgi:hypothetical protein